MLETILIKSPYRISFFGGGTDFPEFFNKHPSSILSTTINKYCRISCRKLPPFFQHKHRFVYSKIELVNRLDEIEHPSIKAVLQHLEVSTGLEIQHFGDLPARSGIGSSSSFTSAILKGVLELYKKKISEEELARLTIYIEREVSKEAVGMQDQIAVTYGGLNEINFKNQNDFSVRKIDVDKRKLSEFQNSLMLFFTGIQRYSDEITLDHINKIEKNNSNLMDISAIAKKGIQSLESGDEIKILGDLLKETWKIKRGLTTKSTNPIIDEIYSAAMAEGAFGGKLLGSGGGGFLLFIVPPEKRIKIQNRLSNLVHVPFTFENSGTSLM
jgi:D-glycero-alpha-D-manno-heptose-7-phosphate kinase